MLTARTSLRSMFRVNKDNLVSRKSCLVGYQELKLVKSPTVEVCPLLRTVSLGVFPNARPVFHHDAGIWWKAVNDATGDSVQHRSCPSSPLFAQPFQGSFTLRAFALESRPTGTKPFSSLLEFPTRNLEPVGSDKKVNFSEVNADDILWRRFRRFSDFNNHVQVELAVTVLLQDSKRGLRRLKDWKVALANLDRTFNPLPVSSSDGSPKFITLPENSEKPCVQVQRSRLEGVEFVSLFLPFVGLSDPISGTDGKVCVKSKLFPNISVGQVVQGDGIEALSFKGDLADVVAGIGELRQRFCQPLFVGLIKNEFTDDCQLHRCHHSNYSYAKQTKGGEGAHSKVA